MKPKFRRFPNGDLIMESNEAKRVKKENLGKPYTCLPPEEVHELAVKAVQKRGGDVKQEVLSEYMVQFGVYRGQSFHWMLENCLGYVGWMVDNMRNKKITSDPLSTNKDAFRKYAQSFAECREITAQKAAARVAKTLPSSSQPSSSQRLSSQPSSSQPSSSQPSSSQPSSSQPSSSQPSRISSLMTGHLHGARLARKVQTVMSKASNSRISPNLSVSRGLKKPAVPTDKTESQDTSLASPSEPATTAGVMIHDSSEDFMQEAELVAAAEMTEGQQQVLTEIMCIYDVWRHLSVASNG
ncbi:uncharacterized protein [Branchiostoma lanceolatum]|uniref:uncharacterized protein n=1 Tax=Branchiostoma lanceolatum TaxID=7740 RepID=UPI003453F0CF